MLKFILHFLFISFISTNISYPKGIEDYIDLQGLTETGDDWQVISAEIEDRQGHIKLHQDKWLMYFLHWRSLTEEKKSLSIEYVRDLMLNFWGQAINFELNNIEGEIEVCGHKGFFTEGTFGKGAIYTRFIVWNCPQTNRQFIADCNINLRRGTSKELLEVQKSITQTICCHQGKASKVIPELAKKYQSSEWNLSFYMPENWRTADFTDEEWFPQGMSKDNGSVWTLLTDSEKHIELLWEKTEEDISPSLFDKFLKKIITYSFSAEDSSEITDLELTSLQRKDGYYLGEGIYKFKKNIRGSYLTYDYGFRGILWKKENRAYFTLASLIQLKEFWQRANDLTPSDVTFENFLWNEVIPYIKVFNSTDNQDLKIEGVFETIRNRRTVREFRDTPVPEGDILKILDAARYAPTAGNVQPWKFVVIKDRARLDSLRVLLQADWERRVESKVDLDEDKRKSYIEGGKSAISNVMTAPVYIMVFVDTTVYPKYALYDGCLGVENLMLCARALGYGTGFFTTYFPEELIKSFVNAPDNLKFICATPIGVPKGWPKMPPKKELDEFIIQEGFKK
jgi:nitroreductase